MASDAVWGLVAEGSKLVTSLGIFYILTTQLGPGGYGLFAGVQALAAALAILSGSWMALVLVQEVLREGRPVGQMFAYALGPTVLGGSILTVIATVFGSALLPGLSWALIGAFTAAEVLGSGVMLVSLGAVQAVDGFAAATRIRVLLSVGRVGAVLVLLLLGDVSLPAVAATLLLANVVFTVAVLVFVSRTLDIPVRMAFPAWGDLRSGLSYAGISAAFAVQEDSDKVLMVRFAPAFDAGVYAAGYRAAQMALIPIRALLSSSHNHFLSHDPNAAGQHLRRSLRFSAVSGAYGVAAGLLLLLAAPLVVVILGGGYDDTASVVRWVAPLVVLRSLSMLPSNGLMGLRRNGVRLAILVASAVVNVVATAVLIPIYSWRGAALATIGSEVVLLVATWVALVHYQRHADRELARRSQQAVVVTGTP